MMTVISHGGMKRSIPSPIYKDDKGLWNICNRCKSILDYDKPGPIMEVIAICHKCSAVSIMWAGKPKKQNRQLKVSGNSNK
jgi:hypothetical protein